MFKKLIVGIGMLAIVLGVSGATISIPIKDTRTFTRKPQSIIIYNQPTPFIDYQIIEQANVIFAETNVEVIIEEIIPEPEPEVIDPRYGFTPEEVYLLAQLLCGDQRWDGDGEYDFEHWPDFGRELRHDQIELVLCVVMNRVMSDRWPNTVTEVVMQRGQFVVMPANASKAPSDFAISTIQEWCDRYDAWDDTAQSTPESHMFFGSTGKGTNRSR